MKSEFGLWLRVRVRVFPETLGWGEPSAVHMLWLKSSEGLAGRNLIQYPHPEQQLCSSQEGCSMASGQWLASIVNKDKLGQREKHSSALLLILLHIPSWTRNSQGEVSKEEMLHFHNPWPYPEDRAFLCHSICIAARSRRSLMTWFFMK